MASNRISLRGTNLNLNPSIYKIQATKREQLRLQYSPEPGSAIVAERERSRPDSANNACCGGAEFTSCSSDYVDCPGTEDNYVCHKQKLRQANEGRIASRVAYASPGPCARAYTYLDLDT